ncbi:MAG TPA: putative toxin-antitoxin system toxin component, PIN family [Acidimicrobiales bacterium]|nr:putative toxin-antitoxin system toxin component, PIN family [Acidimicrobiales bacterium]
MVVDPNVLVSAAISNGVSRQLVDLASTGVYQLIVCPQVLDELHRVLQRDRFLKWRTRAQLDQFEADIGLLAKGEPDPTDVPVATRDPGDDYLVALALAARAHFICTGDHDFDDVGKPEVIAPGDLLRELLEAQ